MLKNKELVQKLFLAILLITAGVLLVGLYVYNKEAKDLEKDFVDFGRVLELEDLTNVKISYDDTKWGNTEGKNLSKSKDLTRYILIFNGIENEEHDFVITYSPIYPEQRNDGKDFCIPMDSSVTESGDWLIVEANIAVRGDFDLETNDPYGKFLLQTLLFNKSALKDGKICSTLGIQPGYPISIPKTVTETGLAEVYVALGSNDQEFIDSVIEVLDNMVVAEPEE